MQSTEYSFTSQPSVLLALPSAEGYNRGQHAQDPDKALNLDSGALPFSVNLDWLTVNLSLALPAPDFAENRFFDFQSTGKPGRSFAHLVRVYYLQNLLGTLSFQPHSPKWSRNLAQFQFANECLYYPKEELYNITNHFLKVIQADFKSISRIDLALDFPQDSPLFFDPRAVVAGLITGDFLMSGREKKVNFFNKVVQGKIQTTGFSVGDRDAENRYLRCYNKTEEIEGNPKPYISAIHAQMKTDSPIWRLEIQLGSKFLVLFKGLDLRACFMHRDYLNLMEQGLKNFFELHLNQEYSEVNKNPKISIIRWPALYALFPSMNAVDLTKGKRNVLNCKHESVKRTIKGNFKEYYKDQGNITTLNACVYLAKKYDLLTFFQSRFDEWLEEFQQKRNLIHCPFDMEIFNKDYVTVEMMVQFEPDQIHHYNPRKIYVNPRWVPSEFIETEDETLEPAGNDTEN